MMRLLPEEKILLKRRIKSKLVGAWIENCIIYGAFVCEIINLYDKKIC